MNLKKIKDSLKFYKGSKKLKDSDSEEWEEFIDEDTGEIVKLLKKNRTELKKNQSKQDPVMLKQLEELESQRRNLLKQLDELDDKIFYLKQDRNSLREQRKQLLIDMEEEVGQATSDEDRDKLGNQYGEDLDSIDRELERVNAEIATLEKRYEKLDGEYLEVQEKYGEVKSSEYDD